MNFKLPPEVKNILDKFDKAGYQIFIIGGAVRDLLLDKQVKDWDFTTDANPQQILKVLPQGFYDNKFGTVGLHTDSSVYEITTMRKEGVYQDSRHPSQVWWTDKIEEDLARRDFTINAMALGLESKITNQESGVLSFILIDPHKGQRDLNDKFIRAVGNPDNRFQEDALRLIRAVRFSAQLDFQIENETFQAILKNNEKIKEIAWERTKEELFKILASPNPYQGIIKLRETGLLKIILPEVERCFGIQQEGPKHDRIYDIGEHCFLSLKNCPSPDPLVKLAALIHDIGKPDTVHTTRDGNVTFYGHDIAGERLAKTVAQRLKLSKKETEKLTGLVRWHMFTVDTIQTDSAIRRFIKNVGLENIDNMIDLRIADRLGGGTETAVSWRMKEFRERIKQVLKKPFTISDLKVSGNDVMKILNIKPGPKVGEVLEKLFKEVLEDSKKNSRDYLLSRIKEFA